MEYVPEGYDATDGRADPERLDEEEEYEEEEEDDDPFLQEQIERLIMEDATQPKDPDAYRPQLMDEMEMRALRRELRTNESRLESDGRMREFVPRKPAQVVWPRRRVNVGRNGMRSTRVATSSPNTRMQEAHEPEKDGNQDAFASLDDVEEGSPKPRLNYSQALRDEVFQLSELQDKYEETKRLLLEQLDHVCTTKPSERTSSNNGVGGVDEAYEKLDELLAFAAKCAV